MPSKNMIIIALIVVVAILCSLLIFLFVRFKKIHMQKEHRNNITIEHTNSSVVTKITHKKRPGTKKKHYKVRNIDAVAQEKTRIVLKQPSKNSQPKEHLSQVEKTMVFDGKQTNHANHAADDAHLTRTSSSGKVYMIPSEYAATMENSEWVDITEPGRGLQSLTRSEDRELVERSMSGYDGETFKALYEGKPVYGEQVVDERTLARWLSMYAEDERQMREIFQSSGQYRKSKTAQHYDLVFADAMRYAEEIRAEEAREKEKKEERSFCQSNNTNYPTQTYSHNIKSK